MVGFLVFEFGRCRIVEFVDTSGFAYRVEALVFGTFINFEKYFFHFEKITRNFFCTKVNFILFLFSNKIAHL